MTIMKLVGKLECTKISIVRYARITKNAVEEKTKMMIDMHRPY